MILTKRQAALVNKFTFALFEAQKDYLAKNGKPWTPGVPLDMSLDILSSEGYKKYNQLAGRLNVQHKVRNAIFSTLRVDVSKEIFEDYLTKRI